MWSVSKTLNSSKNHYKKKEQTVGALNWRKEIRKQDKKKSTLK
jgi:hypothetical protein